MSQIADKTALGESNSEWDFRAKHPRIWVQKSFGRSVRVLVELLNVILNGTIHNISIISEKMAVLFVIIVPFEKICSPVTAWGLKNCEFKFNYN